MKPIKEFIINRKIWARGCNPRVNRLLYFDAGRKQCCLGIYLSACGLDDCKLLDKNNPSDVNNIIPSWLNKDLGELLEANDTFYEKQKSRESRIRKLFKKLGEVTVHFIN